MFELDIRFRIPVKEKDSEYHEYIRIPAISSYTECRNQIHAVIQCQDINPANYPTLTYRFSKDAQKVKYRLSSAESWDALKAGYIEELRKKKDDARVEIFISAEVSSNVISSSKDSYLHIYIVPK